MKKNKEEKSNFDEVLGMFGNSGEQEEVTNMDTQDTFTEIKDELNDEDDDTSHKTEDVEDTVEEGAEDNTDIPQEVLDRMNGKKPAKEDVIDDNQQQSLGDEDNVDDHKGDEPDGDDVAEATQVGALFDAMAESLGWDINDIKDDERPVTVDGLVQYMHDTVEQNSTPQYADERIQQLDEYVKNGGRFEDFYSVQQKELELDTVDIEDEADQKAIIREYLHASGYSDTEVNRKIERYEDADLLQDEAEDALGKLKSYREAQAQQMAQQQEQLRVQQEEQSRAFYEDVTNKIKGLTQIRGIQVPKEDRAALYNYIFRTDANGQSQYAKDFNKNMVKNLIESAYLTMKGDALISTAKRSGETSAAQRLRQLMRNSSKNHTSYSPEEKQKSLLDLASGLL